MFVEQVLWTVPRDQMKSSLNLLNAVAHYMDASGGLLRSLVGRDINTEEQLVSLSFWKSWEDLMRFLSTTKSSMLSGSGKLRLHHYEVVWQWPQEEIDTIYGEAYWAIHDFTVADSHAEQLLDNLRQFAPTMRSQEGFQRAGVWLDRNNPGHIVLSTQWSAASAPQPFISEAGTAQAGISEGDVSSSAQVFKVKAVDQFHATAI